MTIDATAGRDLAAHFTGRLLQGPGVADVTAAVPFVRGRDLLVAGVANSLRSTQRHGPLRAARP